MKTPKYNIHFDRDTLTTTVSSGGKTLLDARMYNWGGTCFFGIEFSGPYADSQKLMSFGAGTCLNKGQAEKIVSMHCENCIEALVD